MADSTNDAARGGKGEESLKIFRLLQILILPVRLNPYKTRFDP
ncbi:hypothetical protein COLO4_07371 [Corchorus olitorius]|uniref:Uncharacterized protein n=1 Tax=Corchorus olitorius TaxID=93759 RepID=A0A1R3KK26_9ROSI|nr:hypothetical protein COLO4_07371 [Corchorus olitorius]